MERGDVVVARSLPDPTEAISAPSAPSGDDAVDALARRWAQLISPEDPSSRARLDPLLRRLRAAVRAEPFWPTAVRRVGAALLSSGLPDGPFGAVGPAAEDVLPTTLRLLRTEGRAALGQSGPEGTRRLAAALDELAAGFAGAVRERMLDGQQEALRANGELRSQLAQASLQDRLTRLPNRSLTEQRLRAEFAPGAARRVGLCALDVDGFKAINEGLGHQVGNQLLLAVAGRLQLAAGPHLVSRTGGDEFAVLVVGSEGCDDVCRLADRLLAALASPFLVAGHSLTVSASIGVTETATSGACPEELMRAADVALSWAKGRGGGRRVVFDPERDAGEAARFALRAGMRGGIERGELRLAFQPLVALTDGTVKGVEALVRWQHPEQGLLGPAQFIEPAEHSGAIVPLGRWVLAQACRRAAQWRSELGAQAPYVSVNVSPVQLTERAWVHEVTAVLQETGLPPELLQLEITEQAVLGDEAAARQALVALRSAGVRLALDDFGIGYSGLAWLRRLPVHALKIDGSFIDGLRHPAADPVDEAIVRAMVEMAHVLGLEVTAEWVETVVQADRLTQLGCDLGQGRWFGDAGPAGWVTELCRRRMGS